MLLSALQITGKKFVRKQHFVNEMEGFGVIHLFVRNVDERKHCEQWHS